MKSVPLNAFPRALSRRGGAKKLRDGGRIPAVIYGRKAQPQNLELKTKEIEDLMKHAASESVLIDLQVSEDSRPQRLALMKEVQHHPLSGKVLHIDFHEIAEDEKVTVSVPVETVGEAFGVKTEGGILEHVLFNVKLRGFPKDLPEILTVDVTNVKLGESIHLDEIKVPEGVEVLGDKHVAVISVAAPRAEEVEAAAEEAVAPGEVEMIKEKKEEGEDAGEKKPAAGDKKPAAGEKKAAAAPAAEKKK
jgi:large subunit ribosomal protein L25